MRAFHLLQPDSIDQAVGLLAEHGEDARVIAGGAMLLILLQQRIIAPRYLISISEIPGLRGIEAVDGGIRFGAATTLREIERAAAAMEHYPVLREAVALVGNVRVRNVATIGGHLAQADPHLDLPPVLVALGAVAQVRGPAGQRSVPLSEFFTGYYETTLAPDEMILSLDLPPQGPNWHGAYLKYCSLTPTDWPTVGVAALLRLEANRVEEARIVAGSVSEQPLRVPEAEALLRGEPLTSSAVAEVARRYAGAADPLSDVRGSAEYKRKVTEVYVRRAILQAAERAGAALDA